MIVKSAKYLAKGGVSGQPNIAIEAVITESGSDSTMIVPMDSNNIIQDQIEFYVKYKIQIPFIKWNDKEFFRISIQVYNSKEDVFKLLEALDDKYN